MLRQLLHRWALVFLVLGLVAGPADARRLALVIGNDGYTKITKLERAGADAEGVAAELKAAGFEVSLHRDLSNTRFAVVVSEFYDKVKKGDDVVVFYAGHGVQTERGAQLLPIDIEGDTEFVVERLAQPVNGLLDSLERLQPRIALVIVDACRDNPLRAQGRAIGAARGLSGPNVARGQMLMFSAASRERALDSLGKDDKNPHGVFARELIARMRTPSLTFEQVAKDVQAAVEKLAASINHKQRPLIVNDSIGDFAFYPGPGSSTVAPTVAVALAQASNPQAAQLAQAAREDRFWDSVVKTDTVDAYRGYLERYPSGEYVLIARAALAKLADRPTTVVAQNTRSAVEAAPAATTSVAAGPAPVRPPEAAVLVVPPVTAASVLPTQSPSLAPPVPTSLPTTTPASPPASPLAVVVPRQVPASLPATTGGAGSSATYTLANGDSYQGDVVANRRTGKGIYRFANGDRYEGEFANDQFMGRGVMSYANGDRYEGQFNGAKRQGQGVMVFANQDRYEGQFDDDFQHGQGTHTAASGERYSGNYHRGSRQGQGELMFADKGRYTGSFFNNKPHGKGVSQHAAGDVFEGDHVHGVRTGKGVYRFANGDRYEGEFSENLYHGSGTFTFATGARYIGSYQRGLKQGQGELVFADKGRYVGPFEADKPQGKGVATYANGDRYEGEFEAGLASGRGTLYLAGGDRYEGAFRNNFQDGLGVHYFANKDRYEGSFRNGLQHGPGKHYFASGDRFVGSFADGLRHGKGVHHFASGQTRDFDYVKGVEKAP